MNNNKRQQSILRFLAGGAIAYGALGLGGCTSGTWYLFGKAIEKNPATGKLIIRDCTTSSSRRTETHEGDSSQVDYNTRNKVGRYEDVQPGFAPLAGYLSNNHW